MALAKWTLLGLIALSLMLKILATQSNPEADPKATAIALERMLDEAGFDAAVVRLGRSPGIIVTARSGQCRLLAGDYLPHGTFADVYASLAAPVGALHYAYRGQIYSRPPKASSLLDFYLWREVRRIGIQRGRPAVIAVAAAPACDLESLPWHDLATIEG